MTVGDIGKAIRLPRIPLTTGRTNTEVMQGVVACNGNTVSTVCRADIHIGKVWNSKNRLRCGNGGENRRCFAVLVDYGIHCRVST